MQSNKFLDFVLECAPHMARDQSDLLSYDILLCPNTINCISLIYPFLVRA